MSGNSKIICKEKMTFGENVLIVYEYLFLDIDAHKVYNKGQNNQINLNKPITIGNKVWFGAKCTVLKGTCINYNCIIGSNSCITNNFKETNLLIVGYPAKIKKSNIEWNY